jgi:hypothetical protein
MRIITRSRRAGKTTEAIKLVSKTNGYLVVMNKIEAQRVAKQAEEMGLNIRFPITFSELIRDGLRGSFVRNIVIDNTDMLLEHIFPGLRIDGITINNSGEVTPDAEVRE